MRSQILSIARASLLSLALLWALPHASPAQDAPLPPKLESGVDPHDWETYYDIGVSLLRRSPSKADAAFYWAMRMDPTRAEPIYGRWVAFWMNDISEFEDYLNDNKRVVSEPKVLASDSLRYFAYERNPVVNQALLIVLLEKVTGGWGTEAYARGWQQYAGQYYSEALKDFYIALAKDNAPKTVHYALALVYAQMLRYDSAAAQFQVLLELNKQENAKTLTRVYESNEMLEYGLGVLYEARGRRDAAREAQGRALQENLGFAPAHVALGRLAAAQRDTGTAATEFGMAATLAPKDGAIQFWFGSALVRAKRAREGVEHLRIATQLEPYWAQPYFALGDACEMVNDSTGAISAYTEFLKRAPEMSAADMATAREQLKKLGGKAP